jgi:hypothetical protein
LKSPSLSFGNGLLARIVDHQDIDYRESSFSKENFVFPPDFSLPPTNLAPSMTIEVEDYGLKASINDLHNAGNLDTHDRDAPTD